MILRPWRARQHAGATAVIVFNNQVHQGLLMQADGQHFNTIPAVFATRDAGMILWDMLQGLVAMPNVGTHVCGQTCCSA
jgi:hypothetical protein